MPAKYDEIGLDYANLRKPDPRIAARIDAALGDAQTILNVGAGAGSYEPQGRDVTAVEPSGAMIAQRVPGSAAVVQAVAEKLPFADDHFDAVMAILTVHHWSDRAQGLRECRRVSRGRIVMLSFDPLSGGGWLADYFPQFNRLDEKIMPDRAELEASLGPVDISPVPIPHDCSDGFLYAYWRRPAAYLDPEVQAGMSCFWTVEDAQEGVELLQRDLDSGAWDRKYGHLLEQEEYDCGYRLVVAG